MKIYPGGAGELKALYKNLGSTETQSLKRKEDLNLLRNSVSDDEVVKEAREKNVEITGRRLDFVDYQVNGFVKAKAGSYKDLFGVFTNYKLEVDDKIYIIPQNGIVKRAELSEGGEIVIKDNSYAFAWPLGTRDISFEATYKTDSISFSHEFRKQYGVR